MYFVCSCSVILSLFGSLVLVASLYDAYKPRDVNASDVASDDVTNDFDMQKHPNTVNDTWLAAQLESGIKRDSVDDVRAALEQGAPVNFLYEVGGT